MWKTVTFDKKNKLTLCDLVGWVYRAWEGLARRKCTGECSQGGLEFE